ncbi:MAG: glycosyltransferase family 9 protein, partial [Flavobacteriales bacterium]
GDVLVGTVLCNNLRKIFPNAQIDYLIYRFTQDVVLNNPNIDNIIYYEDEYRGSYKLFPFAFSLRKERYDITIDAYGKLESKIIVALSGAKKRVSYKKKGNWINNIQVERSFKKVSIAGATIDGRLNLLRPLNRKDIPLDSKPKIFLTDEEKSEALALFEKEIIQLDKKIIMFGITGSNKQKTLPLDKMSRIVNYFNDKYDVKILLSYFEDQQEIASNFYQSIAKKESVYFNLYEPSLRGFIKLLTQVDAYIGNDCGFTNISKAMNVPTFGFFSSFVFREDWGIFEDGKVNMSIHLEDFRKDIFNQYGEGRSRKQAIKARKKDAVKLYRYYDVDEIIKRIEDYLRNLKVI